jgi:hypothetical protein
VTNAGNVVLVVVVAGIEAGTTCGVGAGACALLGPKANETPKNRVISPVVILWVIKAIIWLFPFGRAHPNYLTPGF